MDRYASTDGFTWTFQERLTGYSSGWVEINKPILTTGNYYMSFVFDSDSSINEDYGGVYLDDIEVTGDLITYPNLTYDWPISWSGPIVASSITGTNLYNPDNIGDTLHNGINNILITLLDRNVNGDHPDNIDEFWEAWFQVPSFGHDQAMEDIWYEHGEIKSSCCVGIRGNIDGDPQELIDVSDQVYLIDFMFNPPFGPAPPCFEEADMDADGLIDISDLVFLVDYMFTQGPQPQLCP